MKICAIICEYNPFHNGHEYLIKEAKRRSGADAVLCLMSGNFVQRGSVAVLPKRNRAIHAVKCGADAVIELPTVFATSNAEIFASGAISLLSKIPEVTCLAFGAELGEKEPFLQAATALLKEPEAVSKTVKTLMAQGIGYAQAISTARAQVADSRLFNSPNNILGIEYTKAILKYNANIDVLPIERMGSGYLETKLDGPYISATAIRLALQDRNINALTRYVPNCVLYDLNNCVFVNPDPFEKIAILKQSAEELAKILDCTEGLENAFISAASEAETLERALCSPRYTASRIRRIALHSLLGITREFIEECLTSPLYLAPLAYKKSRKDVLSVLGKSKVPLLSSVQKQKNLSSTAAKCRALDERATKIFDIMRGKVSDHSVAIIDA